jgi:thiamine pyrophosphate-dependent acetolactate synthase large subunit-like protein
MARTIKVYQLQARALAQADPGTLFGVTGDANVYMIDTFMRPQGGRFAAAANENGAVLMAS